MSNTSPDIFLALKLFFKDRSALRLAPDMALAPNLWFQFTVLLKVKLSNMFIGAKGEGMVAVVCPEV